MKFIDYVCIINNAFFQTDLCLFFEMQSAMNRVVGCFSTDTIHLSSPEVYFKKISKVLHYQDNVTDVEQIMLHQRNTPQSNLSILLTFAAKLTTEEGLPSLNVHN